jgi:hypothetical protein
MMIEMKTIVEMDSMKMKIVAVGTQTAATIVRKRIWVVASNPLHCSFA